MKDKVIVIGVIGADIHVVAITMLTRLLKCRGFKVVNLGAITSQEEFISAALEYNASAVLVSSIYGHARQDCAGLIEKAEEAGLADTLFYLGGNLAVGSYNHEEEIKRFLKMGFHRVFSNNASFEEVMSTLRNDLDDENHLYTDIDFVSWNVEERRCYDHI
jgi:methylaspartate mutase sigma subunit